MRVLNKNRIPKTRARLFSPKNGRKLSIKKRRLGRTKISISKLHKVINKDEFKTNSPLQNKNLENLEGIKENNIDESESEFSIRLRPSKSRPKGKRISPPRLNLKATMSKRLCIYEI